MEEFSMTLRVEHDLDVYSVMGQVWHFPSEQSDSYGKASEMTSRWHIAWRLLGAPCIRVVWMSPGASPPLCQVWLASAQSRGVSEGSIFLVLNLLFLSFKIRYQIVVEIIQATTISSFPQLKRHKGKNNRVFSQYAKVYPEPPLLSVFWQMWNILLTYI